MVVERWGWIWGGAWALLLSLGACSGFQPVGVDAGRDAALDRAASDHGASPEQGLAEGSLGDRSRPDLGTAPPDDVPCGKDFWVATAKSDPTCASRHVQLVESGLAVSRQVAIAVSGGQVGIGFHSELGGPDEGQLHLVAFPVGAAALPAPLVVGGTPFENFGRRVALTPAAQGGFHLAYVLIAAQGGELDYAHWSGSAKPSTAELVSPNVGAQGSVDLVEADDGRVHLMYFEDAARRFATRVRPAGGGAWSPPTTFESDIQSAVPGHGRVAATLHSGGGPAFAFQIGFQLTSQPRFRRWDPSNGWSSKKTLDNATLAGVVGSSIDLAIGIDDHHAAYFAVPAGSLTAELRLARWASFNDAPQITVLEQAIPHDTLAPEYELALAVDRWGLLHLAVLLPSASASSPHGVLEYRRQILVGGQTKWISDIVDDQAIGESAASHVAIAVEPNGRPHIAYFNGHTGRLLYATRDDR